MRNLRVWTAAAILCGLILLTVCSVRSVRQSCRALTEQTARIRQAVAEQQSPEAEIAALERVWREKSPRLQLFLPNAPLMELNGTIMRLRAMDEADCDELTAELAAIEANLKWLSEM